MTDKSVTKTFTVTASDFIVMHRFERLLAMLHFNSNFGHSSIFGIPLDADGSDKIRVAEIDKNLGRQVGLLAGIGYDVELAGDGNYSGKFIDRQRPGGRWLVKPSPVEGAAELYKDGQFVKTSPAAK